MGIAVTRPGDSPGRLGEFLRASGAVVVHWPCIRFDPPSDPAPLARAVERASEFDWLVCTSPRAARRWLEAWARRPGGGAESVPMPAAVAGPGTAAVLRKAGWPVGRIPDDYSARGLVDSFETAGDAGGARCVFPCSDLAGEELPDGLRRLGAVVERVVAYRTVPTPPDPAEVRAAAESGSVRVVTFTSPSTVEGFFAGADEAYADLVRRKLSAVAIGDTTTAALAAAGWPAAVAGQATLEALAAAAVRAAARAGDI